MLYGLKKIKAKKSNLEKIPNEAGVYVFWDSKHPIYIGKAIVLRNRVGSYFAGKLERKTAQMMSEALFISYVPVPSEIEALLLEAMLVHKHQPHFNHALKDDKHPLYIMVTKDKYPRVMAVRKSELNYPHTKIYGPFPSSGNVKYVLKYLQVIFPFSAHLPAKKPCLYSQMNLCTPCPTQIENTRDKKLQSELEVIYKANIRNVVGILSGRFKTVKNNLEKQMAVLSKHEMYEEAYNIKQKLARLEYITNQPPSVRRYIDNPNLLEDLRARELLELQKLLSPHFPGLKTKRIECYDIAHVAGSHPTASMVTFIDGVPDKNYYRHFKVRRARGGDDPAALCEIAGRRVKRLKEWGIPDLIIADGGKSQTKVFWDVYREFEIPVVGLAKRFETLVIPKLEGGKVTYILIRPKGPALKLVQRIRDEAHRFARRYHHKLIEKEIFR